jgi:hypothetical protein
MTPSMIFQELCAYCDTWSAESSALASGAKKTPAKSSQSALFLEQDINGAA